MQFFERYSAHLITIVGMIVAVAIVALGGAFPALAQEQTADEDTAVPEATLYEEVQEAPQEITFPIEELGGCESKDACKTYCNNPSNISACVSFAEEHGLIKKEQAEVSRKFARSLERGTGPGGCRGVNSCRTYCENTEHLEECIAFAEEHGHTDKGLEEAKKIAAYLKGGGTMPGGCNSRQSCDAYCHNIEHIEECTAFAEQAGLDQGMGPSGKPFDHERIRKIKELMESGQMPGACTSKEECEAYCHDQTHAEECLVFAQKSGMISPEDAARAKMFSMRGGPGGCKSKDECENFCRTPENREICYAFAKEQGLISPEQEQRFGEIRQHQSEIGFKVSTCVRSKVEEARTSDGPPGQEIINAAMRECGQEFGGAGFGGDGMGGNGMGGDGFGGDGFGGDGFGGQGFGGDGFGGDGMGNMPPRMMGQPYRDNNMMPVPTNAPMMDARYRQQAEMRAGIQSGIQQGIGSGIQQGIRPGIQQGIQSGIQQGMPPQGTRPPNPSFDDVGVGEDSLPPRDTLMYPDPRPMLPTNTGIRPLPPDTMSYPYYPQNAPNNYYPQNAPNNYYPQNAPNNYYPQNAPNNYPIPTNAPNNYPIPTNTPYIPPEAYIPPPPYNPPPTTTTPPQPQQPIIPTYYEGGSGGTTAPPPSGTTAPQTNAYANLVANVLTVIYALYGVR